MVKALKRTVFVGTFRHSVDEKKRLAIPAKWRAAAKGAQEFFVLPLPNQHMFVLPEAAMDKMLAKVDDISIGEYERRNVLRLITADAHGTPCDSQGRWECSRVLKSGRLRGWRKRSAMLRRTSRSRPSNWESEKRVWLARISRICSA